MASQAEHQVVEAALKRAQALVAHDAEKLRALLHPALRWTTFRGEVLNREEYISANTGGSLVWRAQRLQDPHVVIVGGTAVLTAVVTDDVQRDGRDESFTLRLTQLWVEETGSWRCLAGHAGPEV